MTHTKANKSKIFRLFFNLIMYLALILGIVFASQTSTVYAEGGTRTTGGLTIGGESDMSGVGYSYKSATQTLTLNGYNGKEIDFSGKTIQVEGNNTITVDNTSKKFGHSSDPYYAAIYSRGAITITGSGSLAINVETSDVEESCYGINVENGMTINGGNISININSFYGKTSIGLFSSDGSIKVEGSATLDIKAKSAAMKTYSGDIILSGTGEKKILINVGEDTWQQYGINAKKGVIDISGSGKVTVDFINGSNSYGIESAESAIKIHDNANVEVNGCYIGINSRFNYGSPAVGHVGIDIKNSTVKVTSATDESNAFGIYRQAMIIQDSVVIVDVVKRLFDFYQTNEELKILGKSTVDIRCKSPALYDIENQVFDLKEGVSITLLGETFKCWAKLGSGTNLETGEKGDASSTIPDCFLYSEKRYSPSNIGLLRFVYGDTLKASAVADDVKISGITDAALKEQDVKLTLTGDNFKAIAKDTDVTAWFKNMPKGLVAKVKADVASGATEMTITVSGTPMQAKAEFVWIEIPANVLQKTNYAMTVASNNLIYEIVSGKAIKIPDAITGLVYNKSEQKGFADSEGYVVVNGKATNAGKYIATIRLNSGYKWEDGTIEDKMVEWEIARRPIEVELTIEKDTYEYTGYAITPSHTVKDKVSLSVLDASEYSVSYEHNEEIGTATMTVSDKDGGNYQITAPVSRTFKIVKGTKTPPTGLEGVAPSADGATDGKITGTTADMEYSTDTLFTSPIPCTDTETTGLAEGTYYVRYKATATTEASNYVAVHVRLNTVTVVDANTNVTKHKSGTSVTVTVKIPTGKSFIKWVYEGVTIPTEDVTKQEITFTMPEKDVKLTALFEDIIYNITVTSGTSSATTAKYEKEITVTANAPATGKEFDKWVVTGITLSDEDLAKPTVTFEMPASNVTMEATYKDVIYKITVMNGTTILDMATYQTEVTVTANEPGDDEYFDKWEVTGLDTTGMDLTKTEIKFHMPAGNVTFKATYLTIEKFEIYVVDGTKDKSPAKAGETIIIIANPAKEGKVFDKWTCETAGVTIVFESATSSKTTFEMPACEITIQAHFRDIEAAPSIEIKVEGGTGAGTYKEGDSVTITANDPVEGKVFKGWQDASGKIVSTEKSYTFTVTDVTTLTAVYDDMPSGGGEINPPAKKDGLSGGQIAGIIIGSVAVAGIIGFAVLWFAVKKKTFADLGVALKKGFTAIGNFFKNLGAKIKALFTKKK